MPMYISHLRWTQLGAHKIKESPARLDAAKKIFEMDCVKMLHFFMTTGTYDMVAICEAPNDEAMAKVTLKLISGGGVTTQTSRAFTEAEYRGIIGGL